MGSYRGLSYFNSCDKSCEKLWKSILLGVLISIQIKTVDSWKKFAKILIKKFWKH